MMYSKLIRKAMTDAFEAHKTDLDRGGYPYFAHPLHLAEQFDDEETVVVALLHDVVEDHGDVYNWEYINKTYGKAVTEALKMLIYTPIDKECSNYLDYIRNLANNPIARKVKLADLRHNLDLSRVEGKKPWKYDLYQKAIRILYYRANKADPEITIRKMFPRMSNRIRNCLIRHMISRCVENVDDELLKIYKGKVKVRGLGAVGYAAFQKTYRAKTCI